MRVEGAVGQTGLAHDAGETCRGDTIAPKAFACDLDDPTAGGVFPAFFVAHGPPLTFRLHYADNIIL